MFGYKILSLLLVITVIKQTSAGNCGCMKDQITASATVTYKLGENGTFGVYQNWVRYAIDNKNKKLREDIRTVSGRKISTTIVDLNQNIGWVTIAGIFDCTVFKPTGDMDDKCLFRKGVQVDLHKFDVEKYEVKLPNFPGKLISTFEKKTCYPTEFRLLSAYQFSGIKVEIIAKFDFIAPYVYDGAFEPMCEGKPTMSLAVPSLSHKSATEIAQVISYFSKR